VAETPHLTSELMWRAALVTALIDVPLLIIAARVASRETFRGLKWHLAAAAFLIYAGIWAWVGAGVFWDDVYSRVFPAWIRWWLPLVMGVGFGLAALLFWRVSLCARRRPGLWFCVLGGLISLVGHSHGVRRGLMQVPLLSGVSIASALTFGVFEFIVYWFVILVLARTSARVVGRRASRPRT
jgi:hypothetical protein